MAWTQTSATDIADLQAQLRTFLLANGWTSGGATIVVSSEGHKFRITNSNTPRNAYPYADPDLPDYFFDVEYDQTVIGGTGYSAKQGSNDFTGPFPNVWFFTDGKFANVAAQVASNRYSHTSFGSLDDHGMHPARVPFHVGLFFFWWPNDGDPSSNSSFPANYLESGSHSFGYFGYNARAYVAVPDGVADPALDFADGPIFDPTLVQTSNVLSTYDQGDDGGGQGYYIDFATSIENKAITGGVPLIPLPMVMYGADSAQLWLGEIPNCRLCKLNGLNPAQTITYSSEDWIVFPLKQIGLESAMNFGTNPQPEPNSGYYGLAYKKV